MTFKRAKKINLINEETGKIWERKGVVNEDNLNEYFNTVSEGYNIVQHEEVVEIVEEAMKDKNFNPKTTIETLNDGARIHIEMTFPEITLDVENNGQQVSLRCSYDNSYDGSTGLRLEVGAQSPYGDGFLWVGGLVRALEDNYYHRHTKGVDVTEFEKKLDKGIDSFQTKIKDHFRAMFKTPVTNQASIAFLNEIENYKGISTKYIEFITKEVDKATIKNKWQLYCLICDTVSKEAKSIDVRDRQLSLIVKNLHKRIKDSTVKTAIPATSEGGATKIDKSVKENLLEIMEQPKILTTPIKLSVKKVGKKKFQVMQGEVVLETFKKQKQATRFIQKAA